MLYSGLVSVTFRKLSPQEIVSLVVKSGLQGIEWGGDVHVPHGNIARAKEVFNLTEANGLRVASYGSYYYVGCEEKQSFTFEQVLETAVALHAPQIRVWAGNRDPKDADPAWWDRVINESSHIATLAASAGISVSYEYHTGTLTDTSDIACRLLKSVDNKNMGCYWQPSESLTFPSQLDELKQIMPWLTNVHVYHYREDIKSPLSDGINHWSGFLKLVAELQGDHFAMLEFVKDDNPLQFLEDANTLKQLILQVQGT